jgi:hypothetical protein
MNPDAIVLAMLAIADLVVFANLRQMHAQRQAQRVSEERVIASLKFAVHHANRIEEMSAPPQLQQAS